MNVFQWLARRLVARLTLLDFPKLDNNNFEEAVSALIRDETLSHERTRAVLLVLHDEIGKLLK